MAFFVDPFPHAVGVNVEGVRDVTNEIDNQKTVFLVARISWVQVGNDILVWRLEHDDQWSFNAHCFNRWFRAIYIGEAIRSSGCNLPKHVLNIAAHECRFDEFADLL